MRFGTFAIFTGVLAVGAAGSAMAASGTIELRATATFSDGTTADRLYRVRSDADSDGDGLSDEVWLRVRCDNSIATAVFEHSVKSPRDAASGQATGKRMHKPFTITKEWGPSTPMLGKTAGGNAVGSTVGWDLATGKGARTAGAGPTHADDSGDSDDSADHGAKDKAKPKVATYNVKNLDGSARSAQWDQKTNQGARSTGSKTMAQDDWEEVKLTDGAPNLCS